LGIRELLQKAAARIHFCAFSSKIIGITIEITERYMNIFVFGDVFKSKFEENILFAYNEFEKAEILKSLEGKKYSLQRSKGLGENEPEMMWKTTMNPETRRLIAVTPTDAALTEEMFDTLLGDNLPARKIFIAENGNKYMKDADI